MDNPASTPQNSQTTTTQNVFPVPFAFAVGIIVFVFAVLNQLNTVVPSAYLQLYTISFGLTSAASVCFVYALQRGGIVARIMAVLCLIPVLLNAFNLVWAIAVEYKLLRA